jgi:succinyl-CoA synthetase alpha subunit
MMLFLASAVSSFPPTIETAPKGRTMGHAGAIVGGKDDTAEAKKSIMRSCGIHVVDSPAEIGKKVVEVLA